MEEETRELEDYFDHLFDEIDPNIHLDQEQRKVILNEAESLMVIAGAGAGKTTTMAGKVKYLVEKKGVPPEEIVMISLTNQAVLELQEKINGAFQLPALILTFHKFGMKILKECDIEKRVTTNSEQMIQLFLKTKLEDPSFQKSFLSFFAYLYEIPKPPIYQTVLYEQYQKKIEYFSLCGKVRIHNEQMIQELEMKDRSITNEVMTSREAVEVANYLYLHGISYFYQRPYPNHFSYRPDFTIEYEGSYYYLDLFDVEKSEFYSFRYQYRKRQILKLHARYHTTHLILSNERDILDELELELKKYAIIGTEKSPKEIYFLLTAIKKDQVYEKFLNLCNTFLHSFKTNGYEKEHFKLWKTQYQQDKRTLFLLTLLEEMYDYYEQELEKRQEMDFDDMIRFATRELRKNAIILPYRYIIVDEYQDISRERFLFLKEVVRVSHSKLIVVGDDWQSIFAFAGSNISLFMNFEKEMKGSTKLTITHTYRNSQELIDLAGHFVMKNDRQFKKQLFSPKHFSTPIRIYLYDETNLFPQSKIEIVEECIGDIVDKSTKDVEILLIGRFKRDIDLLIDQQHFIKEEDVIQSVRFPQVKLVFMTAHASKGLGFPHVIIINGDSGEYGFPSEKVSDPILDLVIEHDDSYDEAEERRLFYVALTRTKNSVSIIAPIYSSSRFLKELSPVQIINHTKKKWKSKKLICPKCHSPLVRNYFNTKEIQPLYQCTNHQKVCGFETNNLDFMRKIKLCPNCKKGYLIVKRSQYGYFVGCTNYKKGCDYHKML